MTVKRSILFGLSTAGLCIAFLGCASESGESEALQGQLVGETHDNEHDVANEDAHNHSAEGPHGGHLIVLGNEEYHVELTHDESTHTVTVYLLDTAAAESATADQSVIVLQLFQDGDFVDYTLKATDGASKFSVADEKLCDALSHADEVHGRLKVTIAGKPYTGVIEHHAHAHEGHGDGDHDAADDDHQGHADDDHDHGDDHGQGHKDTH